MKVYVRGVSRPPDLPGSHNALALREGVGEIVILDDNRVVILTDFATLPLTVTAAAALRECVGGKLIYHASDSHCVTVSRLESPGE